MTTTSGPSAAENGSREELPPTAIFTNCCDAWWTGTQACHCHGCHRTFTGLDGFDFHRKTVRLGDSSCRDPQQLGMVLADKRWQGWQRASSSPRKDGT